MARVTSLRRGSRPERHRARSRIALAVTAGATALALVLPWTGTIYLLFCLALAGFVWLVSRERRAPSLSAATIAGTGLLLVVLAVAFPPRTAHDVYEFAAYGRIIARYHASPYRSVPSDFPNDYWYRWVSPYWRHTGSVYGPAFSGVSAAFMEAAGESVRVMRLLFQTFAALAVAGVAWLVWRRTRAPTALALIAVNPIVVLNVVNAGHNDALIGLAFLGALLLVERRRRASAGVALALATLVKVSAILPAAAIAFWLWRRENVREAMWFGVPFAVVTIAGTLLGGGASVLIPLGPASRMVSYPSFWHAVGTVVGAITGTSGTAAVRVISNAFVLALLALVAWRRTRIDGAARFSATVVVLYLLAAAYVLPWYAVWVLPVLALAWRSRLTMLTVVYAALVQAAFFSLSSHTGGVVFGVRAVFNAVTGPFELVALAALMGAVLIRRRATTGTA